MFYTSLVSEKKSNICVLHEPCFIRNLLHNMFLHEHCFQRKKNYLHAILKVLLYFDETCRI